MQPIYLGSLGTRGFRFRGTSDYAQLGVVSSAGDVNGDGIDDFIIAGPYNDAFNAGSGNLFVIYGRTDGQYGGINLGALAAGDGFRIHGYAGVASSYIVASSAGDFNGDGYDDVMFGGVNNSNGTAWVVYGGPTGTPTIELLGPFPVNLGFQIIGGPGDSTGFSLSSAGDINNDGYDDIIIGSPDDSTNQDRAGQAHVIFGRAGGLGAVNLATLSAADGFLIRGDAASEFVGYDVAKLGDVNGDGIDDLGIAAPFADENQVLDSGALYVIYGKTTPFGTIDLATLGGADGAIIRGTQRIGYAISGAGDVNADGYQDIIIGAQEYSGKGRAFVVFGKAGGIGSVDVNDLDPDEGFAILPLNHNFPQSFGYAVAGAGDVNGDGYDDLIVSAPFDNGGRGRTYVILGREGGADFDVTDIANIESNLGYSIEGEAGNDASGRTVSSAGDVNADGLADILVGSRDNSAGGFVTGASYLIFGEKPTTAVIRTGTVASQNLVGGNFNDQLFGLGGDDKLYGYGGNDLMEGGEGNDIAYDSEGNDQFAGGNGIDTLVLDYSGSSGQLVTATLSPVPGDSASGRYSVTGDATRSMDFSDVEYFRITGTGQADHILASGLGDIVDGGGGDDFIQTANGDDILKGGSGADLLNGLAGKDLLDGGSGADEMYGGAGDDTYLVDNFGDIVDEVPGDGNDTVLASASWALLMGVEVERIETHDVNGTAAINLAGNEFVQTLVGNAGANSLDGGGGADRLEGGLGNDAYYVDQQGDIIVELAGQGFDSVFTSANYALAAGVNIEWLAAILTADTVAIDLTGNELGQYLVGNAGANLLDGKGGADIMIGYGGNDTYQIDDGGDVVLEAAGAGTDRINTTVSYYLSAGVEVETLAVVNAAGFADLTLTGNELAQTLLGNEGFNVLNGAGGADVMTGYGGSDSYYVDNVADQVVEAAGKGFDAVYSAVSYALGAGVEVEWFSTISNAASTALNLTGNEFNQYLIGNAGANILDGGGGVDLMYGLSGDDIYIIDNAGDVPVEGFIGGFDTVRTSVSYLLSAGIQVERIETSDAAGTGALSLIGNEIGQELIGNAGANALDGAGGADVMTGLGGNDTYYVDQTGDSVVEAAGQGFDAIFTTASFALAAGSEVEWLAAASVGATTGLNLTGNAFANYILGNDGANLIDGGDGSDILYGYGGADSFAFTTALGTANVDTITDFASGSDKIALDDAIFTAIGLPGTLAATAFVTGTAALDADDRILYNSATGQLFYDADGNGAGAAVLFATLQGNPALTASDFQVI